MRRDADQALPYSAACERNKDPILARLTEHFALTRRVLEIGSGTGQHAVYFATHLAHLHWQPSDRAEQLSGLAARIARQGPANLAAPLLLDVTAAWPIKAADAVFTANTLHIMSWPAVEACFAGIGRVLEPGGVLAVYGPFRYQGAYTSASNEAFDRELRSRDPQSGIRDFGAVAILARGAGLEFLADCALPANNQLILWRRNKRDC